MANRTTKDIAWLGGLLEGEGCFYSPRRRPYHPQIQLAMTDKDIVERASKIMNVNPYKPQKRRGKNHYKLVWNFTVCGNKAIGWMMTLYQFFGERRKAKIRELLNLWRNANFSYKASNGQRQKALCHPDKFVYSNKTNLCAKCYAEKKRRERGDLIFNSPEYRQHQLEIMTKIWRRRFLGELPMPKIILKEEVVV